MKDMTNKQTENELNDCFKLLEQCDYDYEKYKLEKQSLKQNTTNDKEDFINKLKELQEQINENKDKDKKQQMEKDKNKEKPNEIETETEIPKEQQDSPNKEHNSSTESSNGTASTSIPTAKRVRFAKNSSSKSKTPKPHTESSGLGAEAAASENGLIPDSDIFCFQYFYSFAQMLVFTIFGLGIRKLFFLTFTQGCVIVPTICAKMYYRKQHNLFWTVSLAVFMTSLLNPGITVCYK